MKLTDWNLITILCRPIKFIGSHDIHLIIVVELSNVCFAIFLKLMEYYLMSMTFLDGVRYNLH